MLGVIEFMMIRWALWLISCSWSCKTRLLLVLHLNPAWIMSLIWIRIRITLIQLTMPTMLLALRQWSNDELQVLNHLYYISIQHDLISLTSIRILLTRIQSTLPTMLLTLRQWYKMHCSYLSWSASLLNPLHFYLCAWMLQYHIILGPSDVHVTK